MTLFTQEQLQQLKLNAEQRKPNNGDPKPVVKLQLLDSNFTWLITEVLSGADSDYAFGLCDLGMGFPELGYVYLPDLESLVGHFGHKVTRDRHFTAHYPISVYAEAARRVQGITQDETELLHAQAAILDRKRRKAA